MNKKFSVIMATLNSERTLEEALIALRAQNYPQDLVEILIVDGGSTDHTFEIAARYGCRIVDNPNVEPVSAKLIGLREASGDYLIHVDSDEVLQSKDSLTKRVTAFTENPDVAMVFATGYVNPVNAPFAARYINEFGDPFSMFYYRLSKDARFFLTRMKRLCNVRNETGDYVVFSLSDGHHQPILENAACANCIDLKFFRHHFAALLTSPSGPVHFFYHMQKITKVFAITKDDPVLHHSAEGTASFLRKIKWRVRNNVFFANEFGTSGFAGRLQFDFPGRRIKKYFYLPYTVLIFPVLIDTLALMWTRRDAGYWRHVPLTLYTAGLISSMMVLKLLGYRPQQKSYGEQKVIR